MLHVGPDVEYMYDAQIRSTEYGRTKNVDCLRGMNYELTLCGMRGPFTNYE